MHVARTYASVATGWERCVYVHAAVNIVSSEEPRGCDGDTELLVGRRLHVIADTFTSVVSH